MLYKEFNEFSRNNWWVYILFFISLFFVWKTNSWNLLEIVLVFIAHFLWDLCVMLVQDYFRKWDEKKALYAQTVSFIIFGLIGIYAWVVWWKWAYLLPQLLFVWPIVQWFLALYKFKFNITWRFLAVISVFVLFVYFYLDLVHNFWQFIQILWFAIFPISLMILNKKTRYFLSLVWIWFIFLGSFWQLYLWFLQHNVSGVDISYTLLPFTVFVFYLKDIKIYLK